MSNKALHVHVSGLQQGLTCEGNNIEICLAIVEIQENYSLTDESNDGAHKKVFSGELQQPPE